MYARVENDQIVEYPINDLAKTYPNISFPANLHKHSMLPDGIVYVNQTTPPDYNQFTHKAISTVPAKVAEEWFSSWEVVPLDAMEIERQKSSIAKQVRSRRNKLLSESDWTQVSDSPVDKQAWANYRQALRDLTSQTEFPLNVIWPVKP